MRGWGRDHSPLPLSHGLAQRQSGPVERAGARFDSGVHGSPFSFFISLFRGEDANLLPAFQKLCNPPFSYYSLSWGGCNASPLLKFESALSILRDGVTVTFQALTLGLSVRFRLPLPFYIEGSESSGSCHYCRNPAFGCKHYHHDCSHVCMGDYHQQSPDYHLCGRVFGCVGFPVPSQGPPDCALMR